MEGRYPREHYLQISCLCVTAAPSLSSYGNLTVGERVVVNSKTGTRIGTLRHLGRTEFADGLWAGVELDEPTGKNDGSVAGKK